MSDTFSEKFHQNEYLSFGAGVNSTALMLLLLDEGREFESVFANHGCDYPETYDYVNYLRGQGLPMRMHQTNFMHLTEVVINGQTRVKAAVELEKAMRRVVE